jgi:phosphate transport system substrate-binding protein
MKGTRMERIGKRLLGWILAGTLLTGCGGERDPNEPSDTRDSGTIHISADESFRPVIDSEIRVFESLHPGTHIIAHYKPEAECLRDFAVDSIRCIIATRGYSKQEQGFINDSLKTDVTKNVVAYDAIAVIVHPSAPDSTFTLPELRELLTGRSARGFEAGNGWRESHEHRAFHHRLASERAAARRQCNGSRQQPGRDRLCS